MKNKLFVYFCLAGCTLLSFLPTVATASPIFETGTAVPGDLGDYPVYSGYREIGATFILGTATRISSIGFGSGRFGSGTVFGAVVNVDAITGLPIANPTDLEAASLGFVTIKTPIDAMDVAGALSLDLAAGTYGLVFGAGQFGTSGIGAFTESTAVGDPLMFQSFFDGPWENFASDDVRIFVNGDPLGRSVPEPMTLALFAAGLIYAMTAWRRRNIAAT